MGIHPKHLTAPPLSVVFGGVSRPEVHAVLATVGEDYQAVLAEIERLRDELAAVTATLVAVHADERETTRTISRAEQDASAIRERATGRADALQREAESQVAALLQQVEEERDALEAHIARVAGGRSRLHRALETEMEELSGFLATGPRLPPGTPIPTTPPAEPAASWLPATTFDSGAWEVASEAEVLDVAVGLDEEITAEESVEQSSSPLKAIAEAWSAEDIESALRAAAVETPHAVGAVTEDPPGHEAEEPAVPAITAIAADPRYVSAELEIEDEDTGDADAPPRRLMTRLAMTGAGVAVLGIVAALAFPRSEPELRETPAQSETASRAARLTRPATPPTATPVPIAGPDGSRVAADASATGSSQPASPPAPLVVRMEALRPCWIGITVGDRKESRLLGQGEEVVRESRSDIVLRVGDAGALVVTVNDRRLPPLGVDGEVVTKRISRP
jgi:hypothetical protein